MNSLFLGCSEKRYFSDIKNSLRKKPPIEIDIKNE